ncbi:MAG: ATP-binding cassette domain-containing protein [Acutalibacteraceae bacterium]
MIEIKNLTFSYPGGKNIFENLSLDFYPGERVCLKAPSGRGKTTLLRLICSLEKCSGGEIRIEQGKRISLMPQSSDLFAWYSAKKNVSLVCDEKTAEKWLCAFGLENDFDKLPSMLSGGMKKRVSLARACAYDPDILLLDEPFGGLDEKLKEKIMDILKTSFHEKLIVFASHDENEIEKFATRVILL